MRRPATPRRVSRRLVLGSLALGGGGLAAGCSADVSDIDLSRLDPRSDPPTPTTTAELRAPADPDAEADVRTLEAAYAEVLATASVLQAIIDRHPRLAEPLQPLVRLHGAHADVLASAAPGDPAPSTPSTRAPREVNSALELAKSTEDTTQHRLTGWALEARSGTFARLLGSMAVAVGQHTPTLPQRPPDRAGDNQ